MAPVFICVCLTTALNPVTGCGMSSTEIAAEPPPLPPPTTVVCVTTPRELRSHTKHTWQKFPVVFGAAYGCVFRLCSFVPPSWCLLYLHMREEVSAVSTLKPGSV